MDIIYRLGEASVAEVLKYLPEPPGYNSVRVILRILEEKGYLTHTQEDQRYIYKPVELPEKAQQSAMQHLLKTFFAGSAPKAVSALLDMSVHKLTDGELSELSQMIEKAKKERKK